jgi:YHS domain-containing protein
MTPVSRRVVLSFVSVLAGIAPFAPLRAGDTVSSHSERRLALSGYDPVAYFKDGRALKGSAEFSTGFDDAVYWFASTEHRDLFAADPDHYAPQYGGFCAVSLAHGAIVEPDPEAWVISQGKLYVFGSKEGIPLFQQQTASIVDKAAENWPRLHGQR